MMQIDHNRKKQLAAGNQLAICKHGQGFELRTISENNIQQVARAGLVHRMARLQVQHVDHLNSIFRINQIFPCL